MNKKRLRQMIMAIMMTTMMILSAAWAAAPRANASGFWISNDQNSYRSLYVYNKSGCTGVQNALEPGRSASYSHDWKTFWLPPHTEAHLLSYTSGYSYYIQNEHSYHMCHAAGSFFDPTGWHIKLIRL